MGIFDLGLEFAFSNIGLNIQCIHQNSSIAREKFIFLKRIEGGLKIPLI